jgi:hypothetical protein
MLPHQLKIDPHGSYRVIGFTSSKEEQSNKLAYMHTMAPRSSNNASSKEDNIQFRMSFPQNDNITI